MQIIGELDKLNKTYTYLYPCLKSYRGFNDNIKGLLINSVGIKDYNVETKREAIFILLETNTFEQLLWKKMEYTKKLISFLDWVRTTNFYVTDYIYYSSKSKKDYHMVVLDFPVTHFKSLQHWRKGEYSKMYSPADIEYFFKYHPCKEVLLKTAKRRLEFVDIVNKDYGTDATVEDFKDAELDYPPFIWEETFNFKIT